MFNVEVHASRFARKRLDSTSDEISDQNVQLETISKVIFLSLCCVVELSNCFYVFRFAIFDV
jgi:hypothetical protein